MNLFDRYWELEIESNPSSNKRYHYKIKPDAFGHSLRIGFDINATIDIKYYSGIIKIYNLSKTQRNNLAFNILGNQWGTGPLIRLTAGYQQRKGLIMDGVVFRSYTTRNVSSGDWITHLQCGTPFNSTGIITLQSIYITPRNVKTTVKNWINELIPKAVGKTNVDKKGRFIIKRARYFSSNLVLALFKNPDKLNREIGFSGPLSMVLKEIEIEFNLVFYYDNDGFNVRSNYDVGPKEPEKDINKDTGMIGSPQYTDTGSKVLTYLDASYRVFQPIRVKASVLEKDVKILRLIHTGDSFTNDWKSDIDASNLDALPSPNA